MSSPSPWILRPKPEPRASFRLFCFPHAGTGASTYRPWAAELPPSIEVCAVQPPGREGRLREPPHRRLEPLVDALAPAIAPWLDRPFAFFGHSLGALVAFALTRRLEAAGEPSPAHLFVSGRRAPHVPIVSRGLAAMDDEALVEELRGYGGTPDELLQHRELMDLMLPIVRADFSIHESYAHTDGPPLAAPISAFGGLDDREVDREHLEAWGELTTSAFRLCMLPGDHFYLLRDRPSLLRAVLHDLAPRLAGG